MWASTGVALVIGAALAVLVWSVGRSRDASREARRAQGVQSIAVKAQKSVLDIETGIRGFIITGEDRFLDPWRTGRTAAPAIADRLVELTADFPAQRPKAQAISRGVHAYVEDFGRPLVVDARNGLTRRAERRATMEGKRRVDALRRRFAAFDRVVQARAAEATDSAENWARAALIVGAAALAGLVGLVLTLGVVVARTIAAPVRRLAEASRDVASGRLQSRVPERGAGEIRTLAQAFNQMADALLVSRTELERFGAENVALIEGIFAQSPVGLAMLDQELRFVRVNEALAAMDGVPSADHIGRSLDDVLGRIDARVGSWVRRVLASGEPTAEGEVSGETPAAEGERRWWAVSTFPVRGGDGDVIGAGLIVVDQTDRRRAAEERERLLRAERASSSRTAALQSVTAALAPALTTARATEVTLAQASAALEAASGAIFLLDHSGTALRIADRVGYPEEWEREWPQVGLDEQVPIAAAVREDRPLWISSAEEMERAFPDVAARGGTTHHSWLVVPIAGPHAPLGGLLLSFVDRRAFSSADIDLVSAIARQCGLALERARLYERERHIAATLQRSLLPAELPRSERLEFAARYRPFGDGIEVGGDFYDAFALDADRWLVVIGDVCGKGPEAAAVTGLVRNTLRVESAYQRRPGALLGVLNDAVAREGNGRFVTATVLDVHLRDGCADVAVAAGGHPPPIAARADGSVEPIDVRGPVIGVIDQARFNERELRLNAGDTIVLYTDGLLDAQAPERLISVEDVAATIRTAGGGPHAMLAALERLAVGEEQGATPRDDIALLAVRLQGRGAEGTGGGSPGERPGVRPAR